MSALAHRVAEILRRLHDHPLDVIEREVLAIVPRRSSDELLEHRVARVLHDGLRRGCSPEQIGEGVRVEAQTDHEREAEVESLLGWEH